MVTIDLSSSGQCDIQPQKRGFGEREDSGPQALCVRVRYMVAVRIT